jgi:Response regulators consisting of a CheY-like receiver domain and a winged-helix DNA-binding domain
MEMLKEHNDIGIILLDIVMPEMNGWEFLEIKKNDGDIAGIPVIIITAEDKLSDQEQAASLGITDYITKPFVPEIVRKRVNNAVTANIGGIY